MYVGGWESDPGFPQELPIPACPALQSPTAGWPEALASGRSLQHRLLVLRTWNLKGLVLCLVVLPSFISLGCSGRCTRSGLQTWTSGLSSAHSLRLLSLLRPGPAHSPTTAGEPGLSLQPIQMPSPDGFLFFPVLPLGLYCATSLSQPVHLSSPFPVPTGSGGLSSSALIHLLSGSPVHLSSRWFWGPTQMSVGDPGQHLLCPQGI